MTELASGQDAGPMVGSGAVARHPPGGHLSAPRRLQGPDCESVKKRGRRQPGAWRHGLGLGVAGGQSQNASLHLRRGPGKPGWGG